MPKKVVVVGAGPAGLTAAYELKQAGVDVVVVEADVQVGGISRTVNYKGNRIDIGGHRFFSKSDWVMSWWQKMMPVATSDDSGKAFLQYQGQVRDLPECSKIDSAADNVLLVRNRLSRIYFNKSFFSYPLKLDFDAFKSLGLLKSFKFGFSYLFSQLRPIRPQSSLEDFMINRFGRKLYLQFFKEYTEKVWGVPCSEISAEWGAQRIKSLSVLQALLHAIRSALGLSGKAKQTSLIESFIYPKYGPGQMWELVAKRFEGMGGKLLMCSRVTGLHINDGRVVSLDVLDDSGQVGSLDCDYVVSTMPIKDLVCASREAWSDRAVSIAKNLQYRDFITVGLLYKKENISNSLGDNWIYIQEPGVNVGRVQIFNNWSPYMVADSNMVWLGLEFFCNEIDALWRMSDADLKKLAKKEISDIGLVAVADAEDSVVIRVPKAYPGYFGSAYESFDLLRAELDSVRNLFLIGRNGMHRYNNQDHSMLTAMEAANQIITGNIDKSKIWSINIDDEYHEEKSSEVNEGPAKSTPVM